MNAESWYAIWTRSHCERLVEQQLEARGFSPFLPELPVLRRNSGQALRRRNRLAPSPMFPGYLFVRDAMTKHRYVEMLGVRGIVHPGFVASVAGVVLSLAGAMRSLRARPRRAPALMCVAHAWGAGALWHSLGGRYEFWRQGGELF